MPRRPPFIAATVLSAALLSCASSASAQAPSKRASSIRWTGPATPACVYKGVMSDAEIEACTGHPVHYDYRIYHDEEVSS